MTLFLLFPSISAHAWTIEECEELFQDLIRAIGDAEEAIEDIFPIFLEDRFIKGDEPDAQVVDRQQRLATLTMLLAALRSLIKSEYVDGLTSFLCEKGNVITETPKRYRCNFFARCTVFPEIYSGRRRYRRLKKYEVHHFQRAKGTFETIH